MNALPVSVHAAFGHNLRLDHAYIDLCYAGVAAWLHCDMYQAVAESAACGVVQSMGGVQ